MSREIKFRAWSKAEEIMINDFYMHSTEGIGGGGLLSDKDNYILMQFTGLHDKTGKEIYEGDILENKKSQKSNCYVTFDGGCWDLVYKGNFALCLKPTLNERGGYEIIGNIYENPNLLT